MKQVKILSLAAQKKQLLPKFTTTFQVARQDTGMIMGGAMLGINIPIYSTAIRNSALVISLCRKQKPPKIHSVYLK